jgi:hypothetical protein
LGGDRFETEAFNILDDGSHESNGCSNSDLLSNIRFRLQ